MAMNPKDLHTALTGAVAIMPPIFAQKAMREVSGELVQLQQGVDKCSFGESSIPHHTAAAGLAYLLPFIALNLGAMVAAAHRDNHEAAHATAAALLGEIHHAMDYALTAGANAGAARLKKARLVSIGDNTTVAAMSLERDDELLNIAQRLSAAAIAYVKF